VYGIQQVAKESLTFSQPRNRIIPIFCGYPVLTKSKRNSSAGASNMQGWEIFVI